MLPVSLRLRRLLKAHCLTETVVHCEFLFIGAAYTFPNLLTKNGPARKIMQPLWLHSRIPGQTALPPSAIAFRS